VECLILGSTTCLRGSLNFSGDFLKIDFRFRQRTSPARPRKVIAALASCSQAALYVAFATAKLDACQMFER
jgi:hypothetical protein